MHVPLGFGVLLLLSLASSSEVKEGISGSDVAANFSIAPNEKENAKAVLSDDEIVLQKWRTIEKVFKDYVSQGIKFILPSAMRFAEGVNISSKCGGSMLKWISGIKATKLWAFQMLDAFGKTPNGATRGYLSSLGDYDGCLAVEVPGSNPFRGQYCTLFLTPPLPKRVPFRKSEITLPLFVNFTKPGTVIQEFQRRAQYFYITTFRTSLCVPSTCSIEEIRTIIDGVINEVQLPFDFRVPSCEVTEPVVLSNSDIAIIFVLSVLVLVTFVATAMDVVLNITDKEKRSTVEKSSTVAKCLLCFSAYTNTLRLLKKDSSPDSIKFFHGMKVVTILWVILNHTYFYVNLDLGARMTRMREFGSEFAFQMTANPYSVVETFFFISAVLLAYASAGKSINVPKYLFRRFWRLTPPFMLFIAACMLTPHLGSGPGWKETIGYLIDSCKKTWWANLLYINNFLSINNACFEWLWYIPADTHLYILGVIALAPMKRNPRLAMGINAALFIGATITTAASHVYYDLFPTAIWEFSHFDDLHYFTEKSFFRSYTHLTTCCIGIYVGCYLAKKPKLKIPTVLNILGWFASVGLGILVVYGPYDWNQGNVPGIGVSTLYACTSKVAWALALSYVTIACFTGHGGVITSILSWSPFVLLSRLTYMAYIVHPIFQFMYIGSARVPVSIDHRTSVYRYFGNVVIAFGVAYFASLLFELPFMGLDRIMFARRAPAKNPAVKEELQENGKFGKPSKQQECSVSAINIRKIENEGP